MVWAYESSTIAEHCFTYWNEKALDSNGIAERLLWFIFIIHIYRGAVDPDFFFCLWSIMCSQTEALRYWTHCKVKIFSVRNEWPAYSPDLKPVEHGYEALGRRVIQRTNPPCTTQDLKTPLRQEWDNIPQGFLDSLVKSMTKRCKMCISVHGQHTFY
ncbi:transposable element Tc1 transposase [Trichonephila clavipes]|nr:transposable element Tc1 transposase [Trichonephila clavipes]